MAVKSIIEIEIRDAAFKNFQAAFKDYQAALGKMPEAWGQVGAKTKAAGKEAAAIAKHIKNIEENTSRSAKSMKAFHNATVSTGHAFTSLARTTATVSTNIFNATTHLLIWAGLSGLAGGLLGAGGLWGIASLSNSAGNRRFQAQGLASSAGGVSAANVNYSSILSNPAGTLAAIRHAQINPEDRRVFGAAGISDYSKSPEDLIGPLTVAAQKMAKSAGANLGPMSQATGFANIFSEDELTRLQQQSDIEVSDVLKKSEADKKLLNVQDETLKNWQLIDKQLNRSSELLENTFTKALLPISPLLMKFSEGLNGVITDINNYFSDEKKLSSDQYQKIKESFGDSSIGKTVEDYLSHPTRKSSIFNMQKAAFGASPDIQARLREMGISIPTKEPSLMAEEINTLKDVKQYLSKEYGQIVSGKLDQFGKYANNEISQGENIIGKAAKNAEGKIKSLLGIHNPGGVMVPGSLTKFKQYASHEAAIKDMHRMLKGRTAKGGKNAYYGKNSIAEIINTYEGGEVGNPHHNDIAGYIKAVASRMHMNKDEYIDKDNADIMAKLISAITAQESKSGKTSVDQVYKIIVQNDTGGNANVNVLQVAH